MLNNQYFSDAVKKIFPELISIRQKIHMNPELSFKEYKTSELIRCELTKLNIQHYALLETGVVALIGKGDRCVALRSDIDALPVTEETNCNFESKNKGIMHACGHDMHTTMLLGAARILKDIENELNGTVMLIFQPGEEKLPGGAKQMIEKGLFQTLKPSAIYGQHVNPDNQAGTIAMSSGFVMASADELYWTISGKGAHAAQPHMGHDPITVAANIALQLQTLINKLRNPIEPVVLTVTAIHGGTATNIIPEEVKMMGTLRTFNNEWRFTILTEIKQLSEQIAESYKCSCTFEVPEGYPPLFNDEYSTEIARRTAEGIFGTDKVLTFELKMWAEDFAYYYEAAGIPSTFWFLGVRPEELDQMPGLHNPKFLPSEKAMIKGTEMLCSVAYNYLNNI